MAVQFEIEDIFEIKGRGILVSARCLGQMENLWVTENSRLGNVPIRKWFEIPRKLDGDGTLRLDCIFFRLKDETDRHNLKKGQIVSLLPANNLEFLPPWEETEAPLDDELEKEINEQHPLFGKSAKAIARRVDCDDVLFKFGEEEYAVVHLIWSGKKEASREFPYTRIYKHWTAVYEDVILRDHKYPKQNRTKQSKRPA